MIETRKETINVDTKTKAKKEAPWACAFIKVCGGYIAFESVVDYDIAKNQK